jgi:hypothetical protein
MVSIFSKLICATGLFWLAQPVLAVPDASNLKEKYQSISDRNPFGLKPIEVPKPVTNQPPVQPKSKTTIYLTGITSIGYPEIPKHVFLKTEEEGKKAEPKYYSLEEEQSRDGISILQIDEKNKKVKIRTEEGERLLSFATDGIQAPSNPAVPGKLPGMQPGAPGVPAGQARLSYPVNGRTHENLQARINNRAPQPINNRYSPIPANQIPPRNVRVPSVGNPALPGGGIGNTGNMAGQEQAPEVDPALQYLMLKAQAAHDRAQGLPTPPIPDLTQ